jgi:hypothetical protein
MTMHSRRRRVKLSLHQCCRTSRAIRRGQRVRVTLPAGATTVKVRLLVAERDIPVEQVGTRLTVTVPSIRDHEVVAIDLL